LSCVVGSCCKENALATITGPSVLQRWEGHPKKSLFYMSKTGSCDHTILESFGEAGTSRDVYQGIGWFAK
jgi:hypothetical protein